MMILRGRGPAAATAGVAVRRSLWPKLATRASSTGTSIVQAEEEEDRVHPIKRVPTSAQQKRAIAAAAAKRAHENEKRVFALALDAYKKAVGHYIIPFHLKAAATRDNKVSDDDNAIVVGSTRFSRVYGRVEHTSEIDWPEEVAGRRLSIGRLLYAFMTKESLRMNHPQVVSALKDIGFPVDEATQDWTLFIWEHEVMVALTQYYKLNGHSLVPQDFVVPRGDPKWPETTWGYLLGYRVNVIRTAKNELGLRQLADLQQIEFPFNAKDHMWAKRILPSLQVFHQVYGHCDLPEMFVVPSDAPWPTEAWGLKLGSVVNCLRSRNKQYTKQASRDVGHLEAIDFVWDSFDNRWTTIVLPTLELYVLTFGHGDVPRRFSVPSEAPWVKRTWGFRLGDCVHHIKGKNTYAEQRQRDHARLEAIGLKPLVPV